MREHNARPPVLRGNIYAYVRLYAGAIKGKHVPCTRGRETERQTERERERERERNRRTPFSLFTTPLLITARGLSRCFCPCTDYADISARARCRRSDSLNCTLETLLDHSGEDEGRSWFSHDPSMSRKSEEKTSAEKRRMRSRRQSRVARRSSFLLRSPFKHAVVFRIR